MGIGLSSILVCGHVDDLRRVIDDDPKTWPWLAPIRELDEKTDTLLPHEFDANEVHVLHSIEWTKDTRLALHILNDLIQALEDQSKSNSFEALKKRAQQCRDDSSEQY